MPTIKYPKNPNVDTAFVEQEDGTQNRALMVAPQDISTLELPNNPNSTKGYVTIDGNKQRVVLTAQIAGEGGGLPDQTGHSGEFLTTDGTDASWGSALKNTATGTGALTLLGTTNNGTNAINIGTSSSSSGTNTIAIGYNTEAQGGGMAIGSGAKATNIYYPTAIGINAQASGVYSLAVGLNAACSSYCGIQLGTGTNNDSFTFKVGLGEPGTNSNYELLSRNGTIPTDRLPNAINKYSSMPTAASTNEGWIVQFTGATDANYTHGYIYECVSDGGNPATYSWSAVSVQAGGGGSLPSQTGNSGKFLTTDGTNASWASALANKATGSQSLTIMGTGNTSQRAINVGYSSSVTSDDSLVIGYDAHATCINSIAIGKGSYVWASYGYGYNCAVGNATVAGVNNGSVSFCTALGTWAEAKAYGCIQIGNGTNNDAGTFKVALTTSGNSATNYELLSSNGTIPTDRLTKANTTVTLAVADWSSSTQTVSVTGVTATSIVLVAPDSASQSDYTSAGILCTAQGAGTLTFTCSTTPTNAITVNVVAL